ncbi:MAG: hypothetical protein HY686_07835 [Chloroflexi bacterium]|nr:hypothetical protein [Chloroflexota bacterium]
MLMPIMTQCRLCATKFEEVLYSEDGRRFVSPVQGHVLEDGNPWCPRCMERILGIVRMLLRGVYLAPEPYPGTRR